RTVSVVSGASSTALTLLCATNVLLDREVRKVTPSSVMLVISEGMTSPLRRNNDRRSPVVELGWGSASTLANCKAKAPGPRGCGVGRVTGRRAEVGGGGSRQTIRPDAPGRRGLAVALPVGRRTRQLGPRDPRPWTSERSARSAPR